MVAPYDSSLQLDVSPMLPFVSGGNQYLRDFSGNSRNGLCTGFAGTDVEYEDAPGGQCISIATPKYINHGQILNYTFEDFTFEIMVRPNSIANAPMLFSNSNFVTNGYFIELLADGSLQLTTSQGGASQSTISALGSFVAGLSYYHIMATRTGALVRFFRNGVELAYSAVGVHLNPVTSALNFQVGRYLAVAGLDLDGRILRYRSWNRALGTAEIWERWISLGRGI